MRLPLSINLKEREVYMQFLMDEWFFRSKKDTLDAFGFSVERNGDGNYFAELDLSQVIPDELWPSMEETVFDEEAEKSAIIIIDHLFPVILKVMAGVQPNDRVM